MFDLGALLGKTVEAFVTGLILFVGVGGPAIYFFRRDIREKSDNLIERLAGIFESKLHDIVHGTLTSLEGIRSDIRAGMDKWLGPINTEYFAQGGSKQDAEYVKNEIRGGRAEELFKETEQISDPKKRAARYKEIVGVCVAISDKFNAIQALSRYQHLAGKTATSRQLAGYVYWWFGDVDTAIVETEAALELVNSETTKGTAKIDELREIRNNLAFYYAEKGVRKDIAFSFVEDTLRNVSEGHKDYVSALDTAGYVYLRFASSETEIEKAVHYFDKVLKIDPKSKETTQHLMEAYAKRKEILELGNDEEDNNDKN